VAEVELDAPPLPAVLLFGAAPQPASIATTPTAVIPLSRIFFGVMGMSSSVL
jgi:hypothetical protein